jgi:TrmH family RNA methyltransferase
MTQIKSLQNPRLKALRKLHTKRGRAQTQSFLAEGEDLLAAARRTGREPLEGYRLTGSEIGGSDFLDVDAAAFGEVSALGSGTRVIGVFEQHWGEPRGPLCVYLHGVGDPGNVGTVLRSAQAFGVSSVVFGPGCADPHGPKAVRASMGAIFAVELARAASPTELPGVRIALSADAPDTLEDVAKGVEGEVTLLIGAEREGLPKELIEASEHHARIPIATESLNAAMAATVALYEMTRRGGRGIDTVPAS